ncbi:MAG TPA: hypothetical protein VMU77_03380, partial [Acidimicrobiales bacterium]|nr:hypothetical protein [Acidimicrobiales bacterium]
SDKSPETSATLSLNGGSAGGTGCQLGGGVSTGSGSGGGGIANTSTSQNMLSTTFSQVGVAVACTGANLGTCFAAEVFAGPGPLLPAQPPGNPVISGGGTQALDVLPAAPTNVTDAATEIPGSQYEVNATWSPPPAEGYDPVNAYVIVITDVFTGIPCSSITGPQVFAVTITGCIISGNIVPFTSDQYTVTVQAVNDLCQSGCAPSAIYPPAADPGKSNGCVPYGATDYPDCSPGTANPGGAWKPATPYPVQASATSGNNGGPPPNNQQGDSYRLVASDGGVFAFGSDSFYGSMGGKSLSGGPMVGIAGTADGGGYWTCSSDGGVFAFGDAGFYGSTGGIRLSAPVIGIVATPDSKGYWMVASDGGVFAFGDATYFGSMANTAKLGAITSMAITPDGKGYWLVSSNGAVNAFGDAGSLGGLTAYQVSPIVGIATTSDGRGYWLASSDGSVYSFGDASPYGNAIGSSGSSAVVGISSTQDGKGYWLLTQSGGLITFGDATFSGSIATLKLSSQIAAPVVGMEVG